jgi:cystathionine beta-synthase
MDTKATILSFIGDTPLLRLHRIADPSGALLWVKPEFLNPAGSIKDRMALYIIEKAEREGKLKPGGTIIENTSGNTGMGVAMVAAVKGYKAIFTIPDKMSSEKINTLKAYGAKVIVTPTNVPADSPQSYYETAKRLHRETPGSFYLNQYHNPDNIEAHYHTTGPEIWEQTKGKIDYLVAGIGTGGSLSGAGRFLKEKNPNLKIVAVDPRGSVFYDYWKSGKLPTPEVYKVEGIGEDMLVEALDMTVIDEMFQVDDGQCFRMARRLTTEEGLFAGGSSGGAAHVAVEVARKAGKGKNVVCILPDSGTRYLSKIYSDEWMRDNGFLQAAPSLGKVQDMLASMSRSVITAAPSDTVIEVIERMKQHDISQLPVMANGVPTGLISEVDLLNYMVLGKQRISDPVGPLASEELFTVSPEISVEQLAEKFALDRRPAAAVVQDGRLVGMLTKIDIIDFLAKKFRAASS